jgi:hypothetical protein
MQKGLHFKNFADEYFVQNLIYLLIGSRLFDGLGLGLGLEKITPESKYLIQKTHTQRIPTQTIK